MTPQKVASEYPLGKEHVGGGSMPVNADEEHVDGCSVPRNVTVVNDSHIPNAPDPIDVTLEGIVILSNDKHS